MTVDEFRAQTEGHQIDLDHYPVAQPFQCVDEASDYSILVAGGRRFTGDAKDIFGEQPDIYNWVQNTPAGVPPKGAVFVYGPSWGGGFGHISIVLAADKNTQTSLEQNVGAPRVTVGTHGYGGAIGWGIPKKDVNAVTYPPAPGRYQAVRVANVRIAPRLNAALGGSGTLHPGEWFDASGVVTGDNISGNTQWVRSLKGNYVWLGNLKKIA